MKTLLKNIFNLLKKGIYLFLFFMMLIAKDSLARKNLDANPRDWLGNWSMNHDGHVGTLIFTDDCGKCDCALPICTPNIRYKDSKGNIWQVDMEEINEQGQHLTIYINFTGNRQKFDLYIFSWDKTKIAGITYWGGRTFGVYCKK